jgi:hypothetical protein
VAQVVHVTAGAQTATTVELGTRPPTPPAPPVEQPLPTEAGGVR